MLPKVGATDHCEFITMSCSWTPVTVVATELMLPGVA